MVSKYSPGNKCAECMNTQPPLTASLDERIPPYVNLRLKGGEGCFFVIQFLKATNWFQACCSFFKRCIGEPKCGGKPLKVEERNVKAEFTVDKFENIQPRRCWYVQFGVAHRAGGYVLIGEGTVLEGQIGQRTCQ